MLLSQDTPEGQEIWGGGLEMAPEGYPKVTSKSTNEEIDERIRRMGIFCSFQRVQFRWEGLSTPS